MKSNIAAPLAGILVTGSLTWATVAFSKDSPAPPQEEVAAAVLEMDKEQALIADRVHMAAPMEVVLENGVDPMDEAVRSGFIVDATLEDVEASLATAAATPNLEDDRAAIELKHRGSYRFFFGEEHPESPSFDN